MSVRGFNAGIRPLAFPGKRRKKSRSGHQGADPSTDNGIFCDGCRFFDITNEGAMRIIVIYLRTVTMESRLTIVGSNRCAGVAGSISLRAAYWAISLMGKWTLFNAGRTKGARSPLS